jgi:hypothetical protein
VHERRLVGCGPPKTSTNCCLTDGGARGRRASRRSHPPVRTKPRRGSQPLVSSLAAVDNQAGTSAAPRIAARRAFGARRNTRSERRIKILPRSEASSCRGVSCKAPSNGSLRPLIPLGGGLVAGEEDASFPPPGLPMCVLTLPPPRGSPTPDAASA